MTNNLTGLTALIGSIAALITAITTLILHLRSQANVKSQTASEQSAPANKVQPAAENKPFDPFS